MAVVVRRRGSVADRVMAVKWWWLKTAVVVIVRSSLLVVVMAAFTVPTAYCNNLNASKVILRKKNILSVLSLSPSHVAENGTTSSCRQYCLQMLKFYCRGRGGCTSYIQFRLHKLSYN